MGAGSALPKLKRAFEDLGGEIARETQRLHDAADAANAAAAAWVKARASVDELDKAMQRTLDGVFTLGQGITELLGHVGVSTDLPGFVRPGTSTDSSASAADDRTSIENQFTDLATRIRSATGDPNNFFAREVDQTISYLKDGRLSPADAIRRLQAVLWNWQGGLFQDMSDPNMSAEFRQLAAELERFIVSGRI